jgi:hypothetical protein
MQAPNTGSTNSINNSNNSDTAAHDSAAHGSAEQVPASAAPTTEPPSTAAAAVHPSMGPDAGVWQELLQLQSGPLLSSLMRLSPDVWPGSGSMAVQLLAFYLNWLRRWWSKVGLGAVGAVRSETVHASTVLSARLGPQLVAFCAGLCNSCRCFLTMPHFDVSWVV